MGGTIPLKGTGSSVAPSHGVSRPSRAVPEGKSVLGEVVRDMAFLLASERFDFCS